MWQTEISGNDNNQTIYIHEAVKSNFNLGTACYHSIQNLSILLLPKKIKD